MEDAERRRIVVVGPCASGKSTLVTALKSRGHDAMVSGQEHSEIPTLWRRAEPDLLIALDLDLATLRQRRGYAWPEQIYLAQQRRLAAARAAADVVIDTTHLTADAVLARVLHLLERRAEETRDGG